MRRWRYLLALLLVSIFLATTINVYAEENHENKTELENNQIIDDTHNYEKIIVDKNDKTAYQSIQEAINSAETDSTIHIKNGYYNEILNIKKKINIVGEDKEKTIINPTTNKNSYAIRIAAEGVKISNLGVQNQGPGIYSTGIKVIARETTISNCDIFDTAVGIALWSSDNTITNCRFWGCEDEGIVFLGSSSNQCNNNIVTNCEFFNNCDGIELQYSSNNVISNCKFYDNSHAGIDAIGSSNNNNKIINCEINNNKVFGIYLSRSSGNQITKSSLTDNKIMTTGSKDNTITDCSLGTVY
jgi:parallel beta-helix repeat protein